MKITTSLKVAGAVLAAALSTLAARADLAINEHVSILGYAAGSITYDKAGSQNTETTMDLDAAKIGFALDFAPIAGNVSLYTAKDYNTGKEKVYLLDANIAYDLGKDFTLTAGRFLTWIGYEAFDIPDNTFITYGMGSTFDQRYWLIPDYHEGVKVEYKYGKSEFGLAILDSIYWPDTAVSDHGTLRGDGSMRDGLGFEAHYGYSETKWSLGANLGYQYNRARNSDIYADDSRHFVADVWVETTAIADTTLGAELFYKYEDYDLTGATSIYYALLSAKQDVSDKVSVAGRLSYGNAENYGNFWKLSVMPVGYELTNNLSIRTEVSYTRYSKGAQNSDTTLTPKYDFFGGVQAVFKF